MSGYASGPYAGIPFAAFGDPATGTRALPTGAKTPRVVDGDYVLDANGNYEESDAALEEVLFLLGTIENTFISPDGTPRGSSIVRIQSFTDRSVVEIRDRVMRALASAIDRGSIKNVVVTPQPYMHDQSTAVLDYVVSFEPTGRISNG